MTDSKEFMSQPQGSRAASQKGFTLIELLVVIAIIAILAALLLPSLERSKQQSQGVYCMNNQKQMALAWLMYSGDYNDFLMPYWVPGFMTWGLTSDDTNLLYLTDPGNNLLAPYIAGSKNIFKCPADTYLSSVERTAHWSERVRSVQMNACMGGGGVGNDPMELDWYSENPTLITMYYKMSDMHRLSPSAAFLFSDIHPDSINESYFDIHYNGGDPWYSAPACFHNNAAGFSFADGHAEIHQWHDPGIFANRPVLYQVGDFTDPTGILSQTSADVLWVWTHWTEPQAGAASPGW